MAPIAVALAILVLVGTDTAAAIVQPPEPAIPATISDARATAALFALAAGGHSLEPATVGQELIGVVTLPPGSSDLPKDQATREVLGKFFERSMSYVALPPSEEMENRLKDLAASFQFGGKRETPTTTHQDAEHSSPATKLTSSFPAAAAGFIYLLLLLP